MKNIFNRIRSNKTLALISVAFFLVSIFTITLTLNLSRKSTNTTSNALSCNGYLHKVICESSPSCEWQADPCSIYSSRPEDKITDIERGNRYEKCVNDSGCNLTSPVCTRDADSTVPWCSLYSYEANLNTCFTPSIAAECTGYFTCSGTESHTSGTCKTKTGGGDPTLPPGATATPATPTTPPQSATPCSCGVSPFTGGTTDTADDNFCLGYPSTRNTCLETNDGPDGFCDLNSDGIVDSMNEVIAGHSGWTLGSIAYQEKCGTGGPPVIPTNTPPPGATNTPIPPPVDPTGDMTHACSPDQTLAPSYDLKLENINPTAGFQQANFQFCMNPTKDTNHAYIFVKFFEGKGQWVSEQKGLNIVDGVSVSVPVWSCYSIGRYTTIPGGGNAIYHTVNSNTVLFFGGKATASGDLYNPTIGDMARFTNQAISDGKMSPGTEYDAKTVLITSSGVDVRVNDLIFSRHGDDKGHVQFHSGIGTCSDQIDSGLTPTPSLSCNYVTKNVPYSIFIADTPANNIITQIYALDETNLPLLDRTHPLKIGVDWGWTGSSDELGPLSLPDGTEVEADTGWQSNEKSKVEIQGLNMASISLQNYTPINCPDVGEVKRGIHTLFSDGRAFWFTQDLLNINLRDVSLEDENLRGNWYTCPLIANTEPQLSKFTYTDQTRPETEWLNIPFTPDLAKLRFIKSFTGNNSSSGSHFTRILVRYCKMNEDLTLTPEVPTFTPVP